MHVSQDGVIRNPQATPETFASDAWDGRRTSYIPREQLSIDPGLPLHDEADLDVDRITYQVLRPRSRVVADRLSQIPDGTWSDVRGSTGKGRVTRRAAVRSPASSSARAGCPSLPP
jgi:hypothetical protein